MRCHVLHAKGSYAVAGSGMRTVLEPPCLACGEEPVPDRDRLPDSHISARWCGIACPNRLPSRKRGQAVFVWIRPLFGQAADTPMSSHAPSRGRRKGAKARATGRRVHRTHIHSRCVHAAGPRSGGRGGSRSLVPAMPCPVAWRPALSRPLPQTGEKSSGVLPTCSKPYPSASCMSFLRSVSFHSVHFCPPPTRPLRRDPYSRVIRARAPARGGARFAAARSARLIARLRAGARARRRAHVSRRLPRSFFSRRREPAKQAAPRMPLPSSGPYLGRNFPDSSSFSRINS